MFYSADFRSDISSMVVKVEVEDIRSEVRAQGNESHVCLRICGRQ